MKKVDMKRTLGVEIKFYFYDKNRENSYGVETRTMNFNISEDFNNYLSVKKNCENFISTNHISNLTKAKADNKEYNVVKAFEELYRVGNEIEEFKKEVTKELKDKGYSFVEAGKPNTALNKEKYAESER